MGSSIGQADGSSSVGRATALPAGRWQAALPLLVLATALAGCTPQQPTVTCAKRLATLERLLQDGDGAVEVSVSNARVFVGTPGVRAVGADGPAVVPALLSLMRDEALSFDTFVRAHSAARRILSPGNAEPDLYWQGGAQVERLDGGGICVRPGGQMDLTVFRREVADSVEAAWRRRH